MAGRPFVFVDRDGTLLADPGYLHRIEDYALLPGVIEGLQSLHAAGFPIAIVTNQSGIGRGMFSEQDFWQLQEYLLADLRAHGVSVEASFFCPHRPDARCACRKPAPGLLERARHELDADLARSWVIGDKLADVELARRAGCRAVYLLSGEGSLSGDTLPEGVPVAPDLLAASRLVLAGHNDPS